MPALSCVSRSSVYTLLITFGELDGLSTGRRNFRNATFQHVLQTGMRENLQWVLLTKTYVGSRGTYVFVD